MIILILKFSFEDKIIADTYSNRTINKKVPSETCINHIAIADHLLLSVVEVACKAIILTK